MRVRALLTLLKPLTPARLLVTMSAASSHTLVLDSFCLKQFDDPEYTGTRVAYDKAAFEAKVNALHVEGAPLVDVPARHSNLGPADLQIR